MTRRVVDDPAQAPLPPVADEARTRRARIVLVALGVLAGLLVGAELYARTLYPTVPRDFPRSQPPRTRRIVEVTRPVLGLAPRRVEVGSNGLGLRGDELDLDDRAPLRVVTLGGSVTECLLLSDADAWPHRLQALLAARLGRPVWVGNAAESGQQTLDYVAHAHVLLPKLQPDLVIVMPGGNDLQAAVEERLLPLDLTDPATLRDYAARLYPVRDVPDSGPSALIDRLVAGPESATIDITPFYARMSARRRAAQTLDEIPFFDDAVDVYRANLSQLAEALAALRPRPRVLFLTHPALWRETMSAPEQSALWAGYSCMDCEQPAYYAPRALRAGLDALNRETLAACEASGVTCYDLAAHLPRTLEVFYDDAHLREEGARRVAQLVGEAILSRGLLSR
jgi:lysophospholipase L1-like esterase